MKAPTVHLEAVSYRYPQRARVALTDVSFTFPAGPTAIVGPNGAGKSTLVKLLTGLLKPTSGSIAVQLPDGTSLPPDQADKAVLFQEPSHLYLTIRQNVTMRFERTPTEDARIHRALEIAGLRAVVDGLPDGIDTLVGAGFGGRLDLSGGQWQRLALARLIYRDSPVMILDEPVASLDPEGERAVFELFAQLTEAKVIIFTTHRYDSIPIGTRIVVLVDGRIAETGTHAELLQRQRHYWSLYAAGGPSASLDRETVQTGAVERVVAPLRSLRTQPPKLLPTYTTNQGVGFPRGRRFGDRLVNLDDPAPFTPAQHRSQESVSSNGNCSEAVQLIGVGRLAATHDLKGNVRGRSGEPVSSPPEVDGEPVPGANDHSDIPESPEPPGVQAAVSAHGWPSPEGRHRGGMPTDVPVSECLAPARVLLDCRHWTRRVLRGSDRGAAVWGRRA